MKNTLAKLLSRTTAIICAVAILVVGIPFTASAESITLDKNGDVFVVDFNNSAYQSEASGIHNTTGKSTTVFAEKDGKAALHVSGTNLGAYTSASNTATNYFDLYNAAGQKFESVNNAYYVLTFEYYIESIADVTNGLYVCMFEPSGSRMSVKDSTTITVNTNCLYLDKTATGKWVTATMVIVENTSKITTPAFNLNFSKSADLYIANLKIEKLRDAATGDGNYVLIPKDTNYSLETPYYTYTVTDGATTATYGDVITEQTYEDDTVSKVTDTWSDASGTALNMAAIIPVGDAIVTCTWKDKPAEVELDTVTVDFAKGSYTGENATDLYNDRGLSENGNEKISTEVIQKDGKTAYHAKAINAAQRFGTYEDEDNAETTDINEKYYTGYHFTLRDTNGETISVTKAGRYLVSFEYYINDYNDDIQLYFIENGVGRMINNYIAQSVHKGYTPLVIDFDNKETSTGRWINVTAVMAAQDNIDNLSIGIARAKGADLYLANMTISKLRDSATAAGYYALIPDTTEYILENPYYVYAGGESGATTLTYADIIGTETIYGQDDDSHGTLNWSVDMNTSPAGDAAVACTWTDHTLSDTYKVDEEAGTHYKTCTIEGCPIAKTGEAAHEGGEATCKEQATCSVCGAAYGELGEHGETVEKEDTAKDPTCTEAGKKADKVCSLCGELIEAGAAIDALGHNYTSEVTKPATCDADGVKTYTCGTCGHSYTEAISAKGHGEAVKDDASYVAPTCTEAGKEANMVCPDCNAILTEGAEIAALGHTEGEAVRENVVDATLNAPGSYDEVVYCTVCNTELSRVTKEIPQLTGAVAEVNGTKYATLAEAIEAAGNGDTVYLLANIEVTSMVSIDKNITLALGEYNITRTTEAAEGRATAILVSNGATVIITGTGTVTAKGGPAVWAYSGNVTIESGNYVGTNHAVYASGTSTVVINGGKFSISVVGTYNYVINILDADRATCTITVNGGEFVNFNPFNNGAEGTGTNFVADGYHYADEDNDGIYTIHEENYTAVVTAPTCVDEGYTTYTCDCGHSYVDNKVAALGHTEGEAVRENVVDATLNAPGSYDEVVYCTVCNTELSRVTKEIPQLTGAAAKVNGTNYGTLAEAIDAANAGDTVYLLKDIELDSSVSIKKNITLDLGEYDITRTTVSDEGRAPAILVGNGATVIITGTGTVTANGGPAVWANGGNVTIESGNYVGTNHAVYAVGTSTVVINGGKFSVSVEDKYHYVINILDADRATSTITVNGGEFVDFNPFKNGAEGTGTNFVAPGLHGADEDNDGIYTIHVENYTAVVTAPTCEDEGYTTYTCDCGHSYVDNKVAALGHTEVVDAAVAPTCTETGLTEGKHCSVCGEVIVAQEEVAALGHAYDDEFDTECNNNCGTTRPAATYADAITSNIDTHGTISVDGATVTIKAEGTIDHLKGTGTGYGWWIGFRINTPEGIDPANVIITRPDGNTRILKNILDNNKTYASMYYNLGTTLVAEYLIDWNNDGVVDLTVVIDGTDTTLVHKYTSVVTAPTCDEEGYTTYTCGCGETYTDDYVDALGHTWDAGVITKKPTATEAGEMTYTCSVCGETKREEIAALGSHEALIKLDVATDVKAQKVTGAAAYDAAASKAIAEYVKALGGTITKLGLKMTVNGETLDAPLSITVDYFNAMLNGLDLSAYAPAAYYTGMNVNQMSTVVTFVSYCEYVDANGETQVLEGVAVDYTFDQYLAENSEDPDVQLIVAMKEAAANAADVEKAGAETKVENGPAIESTYNLKDLSVSATFSYTADDMNKLALAAQDAGNVITGLGFKVTWANGEETSVAAISEDYWNYMLSTGFAFSADAFLKGMNLEEMGSDVTFTAYYICANGEVVIGEQTVKFIDLISGDADAAAYVNAYNGLIA